MRFFTAFLYLHALIAISQIDPIPVIQASHQDDISGMAFNEDGSLMASSGNDGSIKIWDPVSRRMYAEFENSYSRPFNAVRFFGSDRVVSIENGHLRYWGLQHGALLKSVQLEEKDSYSTSDHYILRLFPDKDILLTNYDYLFDEAIEVRDINSGELIKRLPIHDTQKEGGYLVSAGLSGETIYYAFGGGNLYSYNLRTEEEKKVKSFPGLAQVLVVDDELYYLADTGEVGVMTLTGKVKWKRKVIENPNFGYRRDHPLVVNSNKEILVAGMSSGYTWKLNFVSPDQIRSVPLPEGAYVRAMAIDPKGNTVAMNASENVLVLDAKTGEKGMEFESKLIWQDNLNVSVETGRLYSSGLHADFIYSWDLVNGTLETIKAGPEDFHENPSTKKLAISTGYQTFQYEPNSSTFMDSLELGSIERQQFGIYVVKPGAYMLRSYGDNLLTQAINGICAIKLWDMKEKKLVREVKVDKNELVIEHLDANPEMTHAVVEVSNNAFGGYKTKVIDLERGKTVFEVPENAKSTFFPISPRVLVPGGYYDFEKAEFTGGDYHSNSGVAVSYDERYVCSIGGFGTNDSIYVYDLVKDEKFGLGRHSQVERIAMDPRRNLLFSSGKNGRITIWNVDERAEVASLIAEDRKSWQRKDGEQVPFVIVTPDGYFMGHKNSARDLLAYRINNKIYAFDQFDHRFNRPDIILDRLGYSTGEMVEAYKLAYDKRLQNQQVFSSSIVPVEIKILNKEELPKNTEAPEITLSFEATSEAPLDAYHLKINGVNHFDVYGSPVSGKSHSASEVIPLSPGKNYIELFYTSGDQKSLNESIEVVRTSEVPDRQTYFIAMGVSDYQDTSYNLTYAAKDAEDLTSFYSTNTYFDKANTLLLRNSEVTKDVLSKIKSFLSTSTFKDQVVVFFAGHGVHDSEGEYFLATHDLDFSDPSAKGLKLAELERVVAEFPSREKILLIDACNSGLVDNEALFGKAAKVTSDLVFRSGEGNVVPIKENAFELMKATFVNLDVGTGTNIVAAASGYEFAYESGDYSNGLFTYAFLQGIRFGRADLNGDDYIQLSEMKTYVEDKVFEFSGGQQRPNNRRFNYYNDFIIWQKKDAEYNAFFKAITNRDLATVKDFITNRGYDINFKNPDNGFTALHYAARDESQQVLQWLIGNGAELNAESIWGSTPLQLAAHNNNYHECVALLKAGARKTVSKGQSPLQAATQKGHQRIIDLFDYPGWHFKMADFREAIINGDTVTTQLLIDEGFDISGSDGEYSPIHYAAMYNQPIIAKQLIEARVDLNVTGYGDYTPMHIAVINRSMAVAVELYEAGADLQRKDFIGKTPEALAAYYRFDRMEAFCKDPISTIGLFRRNKKLLRMAYLGEMDSLKSEVVDLQLGEIYDLDSGLGLLHGAVLGKQTELVQWLLDEPLDPNLRADQGFTPLMHAVYVNDPQICQMLIDAGASKEIRDRFGKSAVDYAREYGYSEVQKVLGQ